MNNEILKLWVGVPHVGGRDLTDTVVRELLQRRGAYLI